MGGWQTPDENGPARNVIAISISSRRVLGIASAPQMDRRRILNNGPSIFPFVLGTNQKKTCGGKFVPPNYPITNNRVIFATAKSLSHRNICEVVLTPHTVSSINRGRQSNIIKGWHVSLGTRLSKWKQEGKCLIHWYSATTKCNKTQKDSLKWTETEVNVCWQRATWKVHEVCLLVAHTMCWELWTIFFFIYIPQKHFIQSHAMY